MVSLLENKGPLGQLGASIQQLAEMVESDITNFMLLQHFNVTHHGNKNAVRSGANS